VQARAIPEILADHDMLASAQMTTGKTAGFTLPLLQRLHANPPTAMRRALVLTPTRELTAQVADSGAAVESICHCAHHDFGGVSINPQIDALRRGVDILIATPGSCRPRAAAYGGSEPD
jgi:ATP-dependent RNA helicase RhlE